ncbi:hypothetical protein D9757_007981 [Collybiopsis confluens]|uniref:DUF6532 domain-containing protein n=1 Tax=Collybiopsis confluens TaxID=2823264 RepID=A0A8H5HC47_9AGAR|nr:hypothetical protein D9757_007981 [Collybiopsis confluens]
MLKTIDQIPNRSGAWSTKRLSFRDRPDEYFTVRHRDPVEAIRGVWGDPAFAGDLVYKPAKLFRGKEHTEEERVYSEMWTSGCWNAAQNAIPKGGTVAPVIIATDKTQLTQFSGSKSAYPVYLTIGNIPKSIRRKPKARACVLIAYLSVDKVSKGLTKTKLKLRNYEIFHRSMALVLEPLKKAGDIKGRGVEMTGGDGDVRRVYPILAVYVADYPEQCLVTCTKYGTCPKCQRKATELELTEQGLPRKQFWTCDIIEQARSTPGNKNVHAACMKKDVAGLFQGVLKHLTQWVQELIGEEKLDERIRSLPPAYGVRHFKKGISVLTQVSGPERKHICRVLLACLIGCIDPRGITACRSLLHFINLAQYPSHDDATLGYMQDELDTWHKYRSYFVHEGVRHDFNIPKFHSLLHYIDSIRWLGSTDNYNTEMFERLHIDFAKEGWRASNKRDHFPQMIKWLNRQEQVASYDFYRSWLDNEAHGLVEEGEPDEQVTEGDDGNSGEEEVVITNAGRGDTVLTELGPNDNDSEPRLTRLSRKVALENAHKNKRAGFDKLPKENVVDVTGFMSTLIKSAPRTRPKPAPSSSETPKGRSSAIKMSDTVSAKDFDKPPSPLPLNNDEADFLRDVVTGEKQDENRTERVNKKINTLDFSDDEGALTEGDGEEGNYEGDDELGNLLRVEDVPSKAQSQKKVKGGSQKILVSDFSNRKLAVFAKRCARAATCVVNMFPEDPTFCWEILTEEIQLLAAEGRAESFLESLQEISYNVDERDLFLRFMSYGVPAIRLDMGKEARIRTSQFYQVPGTLSPNEIVRLFISSIVSAFADRLGFYEVDQFQGKPKQDQLLVARLRRERSIPVPLIALVTVQIGHALQEYASGYKVETAFSASNDASHFRAIMTTLTTIGKQAPEYLKFLQTNLYSQMITVGPEIVPPQTYDYENLNEIALKQHKILDSNNVDVSDHDSDEGENGTEQGEYHND